MPKILSRTFLHLVLKMAPLGIKSALFLHLWQATRTKKCRFKKTCQKVLFICLSWDSIKHDHKRKNTIKPQGLGFMTAITVLLEITNAKNTSQGYHPLFSQFRKKHAIDLHPILEVTNIFISSLQRATSSSLSIIASWLSFFNPPKLCGYNQSTAATHSFPMHPNVFPHWKHFQQQPTEGAHFISFQYSLSINLL